MKNDNYHHTHSSYLQKAALENQVETLKKDVKEAQLNSTSTAAENEERHVAAVRAEYEEKIGELNEQISIMQTALNEEEEKTTKLHEEMEVNVKVRLA